MKTESFDLNLAILRWRENLAQSPAFRSENLNELESHLHDSFATLNARGLSEEEAFLIASRRIGKDQQFVAEVNKTTIWADRLLWILVGVQLWRTVADILASLTLRLTWSALTSGFNAGSVGLALRFVIIYIMPALVLGLVTFLFWKIVAQSKPETEGLMSMDRWLAKPIAIALGLLVASLGGRILSNFIGFFLAEEPPQWWMTEGKLLWWPYLVNFSIVTGLTFIFARKRLHARVHRSFQLARNSESFDLNLAMQSWRENLAQSPAFRSENLNELESHLRDSVAILRTAGLSEDEAFLVGSGRIGNGQQLETEFGKVNRKAIWADRVLWMLAGIQLLMFVTDIAILIFRHPFSGLRRWTIRGALDMAVLNQVVPALVIGLVTFVVWKALSKSKAGGPLPIDRWLARPFAFAAGIFAFAVGVQTVLGCFQCFFLYPSTRDWTIVASFSARLLFLYVLAAGLTFVFARIRLRAAAA